MKAVLSTLCAVEWAIFTWRRSGGIMAAMRLFWQSRILEGQTRFLYCTRVQKNYTKYKRPCQKKEHNRHYTTTPTLGEYGPFWGELKLAVWVWGCSSISTFLITLFYRFSSIFVSSPGSSYYLLISSGTSTYLTATLHVCWILEMQCVFFFQLWMLRQL